jgi:hypothetical protein
MMQRKIGEFMKNFIIAASFSFLALGLSALGVEGGAADATGAPHKSCCHGKKNCKLGAKEECCKKGCADGQCKNGHCKKDCCSEKHDAKQT